MTKQRQPAVEKINKAIATFLAERRESDGGYAPIINNDLEQLYAIIRLLIVEKFQADPDGDRPIDVHLVDRTKYWPNSYLDVEYSHNAKTDDDMQHILETVLCNLNIALTSVQTTTSLIRDRNRSRKKK